MIIGGLQKLTLLDFPGRVACTVFTVGCNFKCPFCHNASLVTDPDKQSFMSEDEFFSFLSKRQGIIEGVAVTGGEPTLMRDLPEFLGNIKRLGFDVKLDTNGSNPALLKRTVSDGLVDYVAMDIKNSPEKYALTTGDCHNFDFEAIAESAEFLMSGAVDFEFRTTVVYPYHTESDFEKIGQWLAGDEKFFLQGFVDSGDLIGEGMGAYDEESMRRFLAILSHYVPKAQIRGV